MCVCVCVFVNVGVPGYLLSNFGDCLHEILCVLIKQGISQRSLLCSTCLYNVKITVEQAFISEAKLLNERHIISCLIYILFLYLHSLRPRTKVNVCKYALFFKLYSHNTFIPEFL